MHVVIINGSPRVRKYSNTEKIIASFVKGLSEKGASFETHAVSDRKSWETIREAYIKNEEILIALPLYVECVPGLLLEFLETLPKKDRHTRLSFLLQSGFAEGCQLRCGEEFLAKLPDYLGVRYGGCLVKGDNFGIRMLEGEKQERVTKPYRAMGELFAEGDGFLREEAKKFTGPEYFPLPLRPVLQFMFSTFAKKMFQKAAVSWGCNVPLDKKIWETDSGPGGKTKSGRKIFIAVLLLAAVLLIAGDWAFSVMIYNENFGQRFESYEPLMRYVTDFEGLQRTKYEFVSDRGQKLTGYMYVSEENAKEPRGIIVMAHGFGGGGHNSYMDCADYFARHGYWVFAYDATGNDESEGEGVGGLPQGVIDLDHAITFVEESGNFPELPIGLFGHSWGGYSVCSVLSYHPEVKAVIACSGFNASSGLFESEGKKQAGGAVYLILPFVRLHERIKFGGYASNTAMDGFSKSDAAVMILHSFDDETVPAEYGYDIFYETYKDDARFRFIHFEDRGHNYLNDGTYTEAFNAEFDKWLKTLEYDYNASENRERFAEDKADYIRRNLDRERWCHTLDTELFGEFAAFFDENLK